MRQFNQELAEALDRIQSAYPALTLFGFDFYGQVKSVLGNARAYGFTKTRIDALTDVTLLDKSFDGPGAHYVFWDPVHPTTKSHSVIADWFLSVVAPFSPQIGVAAAGTRLQLALDRLHPGQTYVLQDSNDLSHWSDVESFSSVASSFITSVTNAPPRRFFRIKWQP